MLDVTTLSVQISADLKRRFEALAKDLHFSLDDMVAQALEDVLFRESPTFADPDHPETREYQDMERRLLAERRGESISNDEVMARLEARIRAVRGSLPRED